MSVAQRSATFLAITFAVSWSIAIAGWALGAAATPIATTITLVGVMAGPAIGAFICAMLFEKGRRVQTLGLHLKPNLWWLWAWLLGLALAAGSVGLTLLLTDRTLADVGASTRAMVAAAGQDPAELDTLGPALGWLLVGQAAVLGSFLNAFILTFTEELGWRGYLHGLWRPFGFWRTALGTGAIWGLWHAPAIVLYGHNYPEHRWLGVALFTGFCVLLSPLMTLVRDRGGSTFAPGILHGTINAVGALTVLAISDPSFPWGGLVGIGGFIALAIAVAVVAALAGRRRTQRNIRETGDGGGETMLMMPGVMISGKKGQDLDGPGESGGESGSDGGGGDGGD